MRTGKVVVLPYDAAWRSAFEKIKGEIEEAIGDLIIGVEHVGSTAVEGMSAKPCIDIDVIIRDYSVFGAVVDGLSAIGYIHEGDLGIKDREAFKYSEKPHLQTHHLYVCPQHSEELHRHITFRDYLRNNAEAAENYSLTKEKAAELFPNDIDGYIEYKSPCIEELYKECGLKLRASEDTELTDATEHYDMLIEENNDPFRDPPVLREYMCKWDGKPFWDALELSGDKSVLEIGMGTGRIADKVAPYCSRLTGIDISPRTVERAKENLRKYDNISFVCGDFNSYDFEKTFDVIYSSLTMMHFEDKAAVISKIDRLLNDNGILCLSVDKDRSEYIDMKTRRVRVYPDTPENIVSLIEKTSMSPIRVIEVDNAYIIVSRKNII